MTTHKLLPLELFVAALILLLPLRTVLAAPPADANLKQLVSLLQAQVNTMQTQVNTLQTANSTLQSQVSILQSQNSTLQSQVTTLQTQSSTLQSQVSTLQSQVSFLEAPPASFVAIAPYVSLETVNDQPTVRFSGVNVQVVNGMGGTASANGKGNLIVGYDEPNLTAQYGCTLGMHPGYGTPVVDETTCYEAGGSWLTSFKSGSHYMVLGSYNNYSRWGGLIAGQQNTSNYDFASVSGGWGNTASGDRSSVSGGAFSTARGNYSSVSGGINNIASGNGSSVSGGNENTASGGGSSVSGGQTNTASNYYGSVNGGKSNTASGNFSSVLGGYGQEAAGIYQTIPQSP